MKNRAPLINLMEFKMKQTPHSYLTRSSMLTIMVVSGLIGSLVVASTLSANAQSRNYHGGLNLLSNKAAGNLAIMDGTKGHKMNGFGRLFPLRTSNSPTAGSVAPQVSSVVDLRALGHKMVEPTHWQGHPERKSHVPSGYIFLGQFIDHDITLDTMSSLDKPVREGEISNRRSPDLDLDNVYGAGPDATPYLYNLPYLRVGKRIKGVKSSAHRHDLLRTAKNGTPGPTGGGSVAIIGDPRNDENFTVSQIQAAFIAYHNSIVNRLVESEYGARRSEFCGRKKKSCSTTEKLASKLSSNAKKQLFEKARDHVIHYYHRIISEDFLPRLIGADRADTIKTNGRIFYYPNGFVRKDGRMEKPYIPFEFSVAAYRYGHAMVHQNYRLRKNPKSKTPLFHGGKKNSANAVYGFSPITARLAIDWNYFFPIDTTLPKGFNFANKLTNLLPEHLHHLGRVGVTGSGEPSLAARNLNRGRVFRLPSGQSLARLILPELASRGVLKSWQVPNPKDWEKLVIKPDNLTIASLGRVETPLWYYVLQEAATFKRADEASLTEASGNKTLLSDHLPNSFKKLPDFVASESATKESAPAKSATPANKAPKESSLRKIGQKITADTAEDTFNSFLGGEQPTSKKPAATKPPAPKKPVAYQPKAPTTQPTAPVAKGPINGKGPTRMNLRNVGGDTLGPVGGTLVGEVLFGLLEHYRESTGKGLDYVPALKATQTRNNQLPQRGNRYRFGNLTATRDLGVRYQMRNLIYDAGLAAPITVRGSKTRKKNRGKRKNRR